MQQDSKDIRQEYAVGFANLREALQQHVAYCLYHDFDQIRNTDKLAVTCLHCNKTIYVEYANIATELFCNDCKYTEVTTEVLVALNTRLSNVRHKLLNF